jgi:hypothetical protein
MMNPICGMISNSGRCHEPLACAFPPNHAGSHAWATLPTFGDGDIATQLGEVEQMVREHQSKQNLYQCFGSTAERARSVLREYEDKTTKALSDVKSFRDDMLVYFRALVLTLTMTGEAQTHGEKNARLRGAIELLEQAIESLRTKDLERLFSAWRWPDLFRSDWPTRRLMERIHDQEREIRELRGEANQVSAVMTDRPSSSPEW